MSRFAFRAGVMFAIAAVAGCGKIAGIDEYRTCATAGPNGDCRPARLAFADEGCAECVSASCPMEQEACENDPECLEFASCRFRCGKVDDGTCVHECLQAASVTTPATNRLFGCAVACHAQCSSCGAPFVGNDSQCGACVVADDGPGGLCELTDACFSDAGCSAYLACLQAECRRAWSPDPACRLVCGSRYPEASRQFYQGVGSRFFSGCASECKGGKQWACRQPTAWPNTSGASAFVTLHTRPAVHVRVCRNSDFDCNDAEAEGDADPSGRTRFELAQVASPAYYFEIDDPAGGDGPMLFVDWLPLVSDLTLWAPEPPVDALQVLASTAAARGEKLDFQSKGIVVANVVDCAGGLADYGSLSPEVSMTATPGGSAYYGYPASLSISGGGAAAFINLTPNQTTIDVQRAGTKIASAVVPVRAGAATWVFFNHPQFY